jgi:hypothetical protein
MIGAYCMSHYTNLEVQIVSKMSTRRLSWAEIKGPRQENVCCKFCIHIFFIVQSEHKSFFMYIELNSRSLLKSLKLTIGHLKVGKFKKTLNSFSGQQMM